MDFQLIVQIKWILNIVKLPLPAKNSIEGRESRTHPVTCRSPEKSSTNSKKELSKWQLADLFVIKTTRRTTLARITRINFHFTCRWVFAAEWPSMGNPPGCKLPHNMLPIVRAKSKIDTCQGKEDHWECRVSPFKSADLASVPSLSLSFSRFLSFFSLIGTPSTGQCVHACGKVTKNGNEEASELYSRLRSRERNSSWLSNSHPLGHPLELSSDFTTGTNHFTAKRFTDLSFNFA